MVLRGGSMLLRVFLIALLWVAANGAERIVALSPSINEILFALGAGEEVIANTEYCNYPSEAKRRPKVGGYFSPSLEKILALKPTLVILQENNAMLASKLERLGIRTIVIKIDTYRSIRESIFTIARAVNKKEEGAKIVGGLDRKLRSLAGIVNGKKILMVFGQNTDLSKPLYVSGQNLYFDDIIRASGNRNALQSSRKGQPVVNMEQVIGMNPDIVVLLAPNTAQMGLTPAELIRPWKKLPIDAARGNRIYVADQEYSNNPSDRLGLFLDDFRGFLLHAAR